MPLFTHQTSVRVQELLNDYRAGLFTKKDTPSDSVSLPGCVLCRLASSDTVYEPGDVVPFVSVSASGPVSLDSLPEAEYLTIQNFSCWNRCWVIETSFSESDLDFQILHFGIARDYLSSDSWGNVQVVGTAFAAVEMVPLGASHAAHGAVVLRKNTRYEGKPFLQSAAAGPAHIVSAPARTLDDGRVCTLLELGTSWNRIVAKMQSGTASAEFSQIFRGTPRAHHLAAGAGGNGNLNVSWGHSGISCLSSSWSRGGSASFTADYRLLEPYFPELDNLPAVELLAESGIAECIDPYYLPTGGTELNAIAFVNYEEHLLKTTPDSTDYNASDEADFIPDYYISDGLIRPIGSYTTSAVFCTDNTGNYLKIGRVKFRNFIGRVSSGLAVPDIWPNDYVTVRLRGGSETVEIIGCPMDYKLNTELFFTSPPESRLLSRGWEDYTQEFMAASGVLSPRTVGTFWGSWNFAVSDDADAVTCCPFPFVVYRKKTSGFTF